jgi:hypothetical protein
VFARLLHYLMFSLRSLTAETKFMLVMPITHSEPSSARRPCLKKASLRLLYVLVHRHLRRRRHRHRHRHRRFNCTVETLVMACIWLALISWTPRSFTERRPRLLIINHDHYSCPSSYCQPISGGPRNMPSSNPEWADQRALVLLGHIILGSHFNNKQLRPLCSPNVTPVHAKAI